jgi:hypothetical protein
MEKNSGAPRFRGARLSNNLKGLQRVGLVRKGSADEAQNLPSRGIHGSAVSRSREQKGDL